MMIIARLLLSRLRALCLLIPAGLILTLLPSPALCEGFVEGAYPRAIAYDKKSPAAGRNSGPVRLLAIEKRVWRLPAPEGFLDIETLTTDTLPHWARVPATNLRPWGAAYYADPTANNGPPPFSLAFLDVVTKDNRDEADALGFPLRGSLRRDKTCAALSDFFAGTRVMDAAFWQTALDEAMKGEDLDCRYNNGDARVILEVTVGSGDVLPGVRERAEEFRRKMAEPVDATSEEAVQAYQKLVEEWTNEFPPGELPSSSHPSGRATLLFPCGKQRVLLTVEYVPLASPEQLKQALDRAMRWKERIQSLNGK